MKKSTIFLILLVYIASFVIVGLFGIQVRAHNEIVYVENISLTPINQEALVNYKYDETNKKYTFIAYYEDGLVIQLKANVTPANATNSAVKVSYDSEIAEITVVDSVFININVKEDGALDFSVVSTDGLDLTINATLLVLYA